MKTYEEVSTEVREFIANHLNLPAQEVTVTSHLSDLATNSIALFELLLAFEQF